MIPLLALLLAAPAATSPADRATACVAMIKADPAKAATQAQRWLDGGGGVDARQCLGLALARQERWTPASLAFEQAAAQAGAGKDGRAAGLWVQAGNAALAADELERARTLLGRALALPILTGEMRGEALLDRARAAVALADLKAARTDIDGALALVPADPLAWLLSATLARRQQDLPRARADIARALKLSADDAAVQYEAGAIAMLSDDVEGARSAWGKAATMAPGTPAADAAKQGLAQLAKP